MKPLLADGWQRALVTHLRGIFEPDDAVRAFFLFGSLTEPKTVDRFSDVDACIVVGHDAMARFFPSLAWAEPVAPVFAWASEPRDYGGLHRLRFADMRALDLVVMDEALLAAADLSQRNPFRLPIEVVFARSQIFEQARSREWTPTPMIPDVDAIADRFWFVAQHAVQKAVRGDLLIALHLVLALQRDTLELAMALRDREIGDTDHRFGSPSDAAVLRRLPSANAQTAANVLDTIEATARLFDDLSAAWDARITARLPVLRPLLEQASAPPGDGTPPPSAL